MSARPHCLGQYSPVKKSAPISRGKMVKAFARFMVAMAVLPVAPRLSLAEGAPAPAANTLFGFLNPATGIFTPAPQPPEPRATAAGGPIFRRGTLVVIESFTTPTTVPATTLFQDIVTVETNSQAGSVTYSDTAGYSGVAHRRGGSGRIVVKVPYVFAVASASETLTVTCLMTSPTGDEATLTQTIPLPANNATTTLNVSQRF